MIILHFNVYTFAILPFHSLAVLFAVSLSLLVLFSANAVFSVLKFAEPDKLSMSEFIIPTTTDDAFVLILDLIGVNTGVGTVIATFVSITLIIFLRFANIPNIARLLLDLNARDAGLLP